MTEDTTSSSATTTSSLGKSLGVIAVAAVIMLVADVAGSYALIIAGWGRQPVMLVALPVILVALVLALLGTARLITGRAHVIGSILIALLFAVLCGVAITTSRVAPAFFGDNAWVHFALSALCAVAFGLFLGPMPIRILGAAAAIGAIVLVSLQPSADDRLAAASEQAHSDEIAEYLDAAVFPYLTTVQGWDNAHVVTGRYGSTTWLISDSLAIAQVHVVDAGDGEDLTSRACSQLIPPGADAEGDWCVRTTAGWGRADGTGVAYVDGGRLVALTPFEESLWAYEPGSTPATVEDVAVLAGTLRVMTDDEIEQFIVPAYSRGGQRIVLPEL